MLDMSLPEGKVVGIDIMISPRYKIIITQACNGIIPYLIYMAGVLAYNSRLTHKLKWLLIGYAVISFINLIRLLIVVYFVTINPEYLWISHDIFGNALLMATGLLLFYLYLRTNRALSREYLYQSKHLI